MTESGATAPPPTGGGGPTERFPQDQPPTGADATIVCDRLVRIYSGDGIEVQALQGLDLLIAEGELTALIGAAGSGKSTLMNILAGLDTATAGTVWVADHNLGTMTGKARLAYRRSTVGFIWQQTSRNLLPYLVRDAEGLEQEAGAAQPLPAAKRGEPHRQLHVLPGSPAGARPPTARPGAGNRRPP